MLLSITSSRTSAWAATQTQQRQQHRARPAAAAAAAHWQQQPQPQQDHRSSSNAPAASPSSITLRIKQAGSTVELLQLHAAHRGSMDCIHYAALFNKLVQAAQYAEQGGCTSDEQPQARHYHQQQRLYQQQHSPAAHRQQLLQALLADLPYIIHSLQPGPLCVVLRALVKLRVQPHPQLLLALLHHAHRVLGFAAFQPRELCTVAHALAELPPLDLPWTAGSPQAAAVASCSPQQQQQQQQQQQLHGAPTGAGQQDQDHPGDHMGSSGSSSWDPLLLQELFLALGSGLQRCNAQDAAQALMAAARLRYTPSEAWLQLWLRRATQLLPQFSPQGLANAAYGLVRALQLRGEASSGNSTDWTPLSCPSSAGSSSGVRGADFLQRQSQQPQQPSALLHAARTWLQSCLQVSVLHAGTLKPQELAGQLLWAAGRLSCSPPDPARHHLLASAQAMLPACDARHLCATLYAFALLGHRPDVATARVFWSCLAQQVPHLGPRDLDEVLWAAGRLQLQPPGRVRQLLQQHALSVLPLGEQQRGAMASDGQSGGQHSSSSWQGPRHVVSVLRGMAALRWQLQEKYLVRFQGVLLELLEQCVPQDYANTLWALATAGTTVEARWLDRVLMAASSSLEQFSPQELSVTAWALAKLQHHPPKPWMQQLLLASLQQLSRFAPADYAQTLWALSRLQVSPSPLWCSSFWSKSGQCLTRSSFSAAELHALLLAAAKLEAQPPQKWVQAAAGAVERGLAGFNSQQLLEVLLVLQKLSAASETSAAAAAGADGSSSGSAAQQSSSIVPLASRSARAQVLGSRLLLKARPGGRPSSSSSSPPGVMRLYRQLVATKRVLPAGEGLVRPMWPPSSSSSNSGLLSLSAGSSSGLLSSGSSTGRQQQQQGLAGVSAADEAFGLACLVLLMPDQLRSRVEHFPRLLAAERVQQQQQHVLQGDWVCMTASRLQQEAVACCNCSAPGCGCTKSVPS